MTSTNPTSLFSLKGNYPFLMKHQSKYRWWKPVCVALLALVLYIVFSVVAYLAIYAISGGDPQVQAAMSPSTDGAYVAGDQNDPFVLLVTFIPIALGIPSIAISMRAFGLGGLKTLSSTEGKLRWKRFVSYVPLTFCVALVIIVAETAFSVALGAELGECTFAPIALIVIVLICPFQCAAEEYVFRGFLFQGFSSWIPVAVIPLVIQTVLFALCHGYNSIGLLCVALMGACTAWLAIKTGGLEAPISMHAVNNVISFGIGSLFVSQTTQSEITIEGLICDVILVLAMTTTLYLISKRKGYLEK